MSYTEDFTDQKSGRSTKRTNLIDRAESGDSKLATAGNQDHQRTSNPDRDTKKQARLARAAERQEKLEEGCLKDGEFKDPAKQEP